MGGDASAAGARSVDDITFEVMYRAELTSMVALAVSLTGDDQSGLDIAHEAMLRAYRSWSNVGGLDRPGAWVRRVVVNLAIDRQRRRTVEQRGLDRLTAEPSRPPDEAGVDEFWAAVRDLPSRQRAVTALHYLEDLSVDDIAAILEITGGTVKTTLFVARASLARRLRLAEEAT